MRKESEVNYLENYRNANIHYFTYLSELTKKYTILERELRFSDLTPEELRCVNDLDDIREKRWDQLKEFWRCENVCNKTQE